MSLIKVKVTDTHVTNRSGVSTKGKPYSMNTQDNVFVELNSEVRKMPLNLPDGVSAYAPGNYTIDPVTLLRLNNYSRLEVDGYVEIKLTPVIGAAIPQHKMANG